MATIGSASHASLTNVPRRSYIAMNSYTSDLFGYSLTFNPTTFTNVGSLSNLGVPASSTLQGSILSETGKKLYPVVNAGVSTLMVSVYDQTSKITGFINPNSPTFAIFSTDKPPYMGQGVDPGTSGLSNLGNSIYTHGSVIADGFGTYADLLSTGTSLTVGSTASIRLSLSTGTSATVGTTLSVGQTISSGTVVIAPSTFTQHLYVVQGSGGTDGKTASTTASAGSTSAAGNNIGGFSYTTISSSAVTANSKIFITGTGSQALGVINSSNSPGNRFVVKSSGNTDGQTINWWIIN
jgi:hypothetical protein